ncbi:MAG TPA: hemerythrin family protein [Polyangiaceae bacterium]
MDRFVFTDDLLTGMDDIDAQHRMLFELANQVVDPTTQRGADAAFFASLAFLSEYVQFHFAAENLAMQQANYPARDSHLAAHTAFRQRIAELLESALETVDISELRVRLQEAVTGWFAHHIRTADKALAQYLRLQAGSTLPPGLPDSDELVDSGFADKRVSWSVLRAAIDSNEP